MLKTFRSAVFFLCALTTLPAAADPAAHQEAARQLLAAVNMERMLSQSIEQMLELQIQQNPQLAPFRQTMLDFLDKYMSYESLEEDLVALYAEAFSEAELRDLVAFYETPTGQKTVQLMPTLMSRGAQIGAKRVQDNIGELQKAIQAAVEAQSAEQSQDAEEPQDASE
jgi:hypothetical protein